MAALLADIGGTNTRCALAGADGPEAIRRFRNADYDALAELLAEYLDAQATGARPSTGIIAVAGPVLGDAVQMTNLDWSISAPALCRELGLQDIRLLNDFEAQAYALPAIAPDTLLQVGSGRARPEGVKGVLGPGTGLGVASLVPEGNDWRALPGEGGHVTLAASDVREANLVQTVRERYGHCSAERLISGPGLSLLHELLHGEEGIGAPEIGRRMQDGDAPAGDTFETFCRLLGTVASNLALTLGAGGGIYIGGGILPRHAQRFASSGFRERFEAKARYKDYLAAIPTFLITEQAPALIGLWTRAGRDC